MTARSVIGRAIVAGVLRRAHVRGTAKPIARSFASFSSSAPQHHHPTYLTRVGGVSTPFQWMATARRSMAYGLAQQREGEEERYVPPYHVVVFEAKDVVFRSGAEADFRVNGDVRDAIQCLKFDGVKTALICTQGAPLAHDSIKDLEIAQHFNAVITPGGSPGVASEELSGLLGRLGDFPSDRCIYVGTSGLEAATKLGMMAIKWTGDQDDVVRALEAACETSLVNFAWTRDIYAGVLWKNSKDCTREDEAK